MSQRSGDLERRPKRPKTKARLEQLITQWQKDSGQPVARLNLRIAAMMLAGALARVIDADEHVVFAAKGGIAMELRMGGRARETRDIDLVLRGRPENLSDLLDEGLGDSYNDFSFRRGEITDLPARPQVKKMRVQVRFAGRVLCSPQLEITPTETGEEEFEELPGMNLAAVGLVGPEFVPVLSERWQIAQKLHAVTERYPDGLENPRFRDLIDLQLLKAIDSAPAAVKDACERVFATRAQQAWPPTLIVPSSWDDTYTALARELDFGTTDVEQAAQTVRAYVQRIAEA